MARSRYKIIEKKEPHFLTCTIVDWIPLFTDISIINILLESMTFLQKQKRLILYSYVIMKDHLHLIASAINLSKEIGNYKSFTARKIVDMLKESGDKYLLSKLRSAKLSHKKKSTYQVWQEGSHPEAIQGPEMMRQKIEYIHYNPVRAKYVENPVDWKYSSSSNYELGYGVLEVTTEW